MINCSDLGGEKETKASINEHDVISLDQGPTFAIGQLAKQYKITLRALRFYEVHGLLNPVRKGTKRFYGTRDCQCIEMILRGRQLGHSIAEIHGFIQPGNESAKVIHLESKLSSEQILSQIRNLERRRADLDKIIYALRNAKQRIADRVPPDKMAGA